jgi:hypothetical protein
MPVLFLYGFQNSNKIFFTTENTEVNKGLAKSFSAFSVSSVMLSFLYFVRFLEVSTNKKHTDARGPPRA